MDPLALVFLSAGAFVIVGAVVVIGSFFKLNKKKDKSPYLQRPNFFESGAEFSLFKTVAEVCGDKYFVFPHIHLGHVLEVRNKVDWKERSNYRSRIDRKAGDIAICNKDTGDILAIVDLGNDAHNFPDKKSRDKFVEDIAQVGSFALIDLRPSMGRGQVEEELKKFLPLLR